MYPTAYTWIRNPTPVTTSSITADKGSSTYVQSTLSPPPSPSGPSTSHVHTVCVTRCAAASTSSPGSDAGSDPRPHTAPTDTTNDPSTVPQATTATARRDSRHDRSPVTTNPAKGNSGTTHNRRIIGAASPAQQADVVDVGGLAPAEQRQDDRQPDRRLAGGDRDHEQREDMPGHRPQLVGEGDERQVHGVEHQLDRHQDDDHVATDEDA